MDRMRVLSAQDLDHFDNRVQIRIDMAAADQVLTWLWRSKRRT